MNTVEITEYFEINDVIELLKSPDDLEDIRNIIEDVQAPYCSGDREKEQKKIISNLAKELELTEKWIKDSGNLIHDFESLSASKKEQYLSQFKKMKDLKKSNSVQSEIFLDRF